ncbi:MAG: superoxide dismutase [Proteobacteria bacterium SG_bin5]|nr:superoxide dismutase [Sphingomonas sp.]OQW39292.1 MAG: superoxide dismutase [Proteobacteria bacterium SG_bin5]
MAFELPPLPYDYEALSPTIDGETMRFHHDKHHKAYTDKLNEGVAANAALEGKSIEDILGQISTLPALVRNNGGGYWNHDFFWKIMGPNGGEPSGKLAEAIATYGGLDKLKDEFNNRGAGQFGSGWAWVVADAQGVLSVGSTPNQDNPLMDDVALKGMPILGNDVWEHAYYLTYRNDRAGYLKAWWNVVNWEEAGRRYEAAIAG